MAVFFLFVLGMLVSAVAVVIAAKVVPAKIEAMLRRETAKKKPGVWNKRHPALRDLKLIPNNATDKSVEVKLKVKIIEATGLAPAEKNGSSDAYVRVSFNGVTRKTKFIPKSLHPHWNERCVFPVTDLNENLLLNVFDHEAVGSDRSLGTKQLSISDLVVGKEHDFWTGLEGVASTDSGKVEATGQVHLSIELLSSSSPEWNSLDTQSGMDGKEEVLKVTIVEAENLMPMRANGPADPCVKLTIGEHKRETPAVAKTVSPTWNVTTFFTVSHLESEKMSITVLDKASGKSMGNTVVRLSHFFPNLNATRLTDATHNVERSCWLELDGYAQTENKKVSATGHIHVMLELLDPEITTPMRQKEAATRGSATAAAAPQALGGLAQSFGNSIIMRHISGLGGGSAKATKEKEKEKIEKAVRRQFDVAELKFRLKVQIIEARNLVAADSNGKSSPFVKIKCGVGKAKTDYQSKTLNPEWNSAFYLGVADLEKDKLYLTVMSHEKISEHRPLGAAIVALDRLAAERSRDLWVPLEGYATTTSGKMTRLASGEVHVIIDRLDVAPAQTIDPPPRSHAPSTSETDTRTPRPEGERLPGRVRVTAVEATDLLPFNEKELPDVLLKLYVKGKKYEAPTQKKTTNPQWSNFSVEFDVDDLRSEKVIVKIVEAKSFVSRDRPLGTASISLAELPSGVQRESWVALDGVTTVEENKKKREVKVRGDIHLLMTFTEKIIGASSNGSVEIVRQGSSSVPPSRPPTPPLVDPIAPPTPHKAEEKPADPEDNTPEYMCRTIMTLTEIRDDDLKPVSIVATRILRDLTSSEEFQAKILYKIRGALGKIIRPWWLGPLALEEFDLGMKKHLTLEGKLARVLTTTNEGELIAEAEAVADAGINIGFSASVILPIPFIGPLAIPIAARLSVHKLHGKINLYFPPQSNEQFSISFLDLPYEADYTPVLKIGRAQFDICKIKRIRSLIDAVIMFGLRKAMVYPSVLALFLPIPGIDVDPDIISGKPVNDPPPPLPTESKQRKGKERPYPNDKSDVRALKVLYGRFIDEVLNKCNYNLIPELFMDNAVLHGFGAEDTDLAGLPQVRIAIETLRKMYPDMQFYIEDLVCDTYNPSVRSVICRWRGLISGAPLLYGLHCARVDLNEHKIIDMWQYWHPGSALGLGDKWTKILSAFASGTPLPSAPPVSEPNSPELGIRKSSSVHDSSRKTTRKVAKGQRCLRIEAVEGRNLIAADSNGLSDPYLKLRLGESKSVKTGVAKETLNPLWNQTLLLPIPNTTPPPTELRVEAWDEDAFKDDPLGHCLIPLVDLQLNVEKKGWYQLQGVLSGEVCIGVTAIVAADNDLASL